MKNREKYTESTKCTILNCGEPPPPPPPPPQNLVLRTYFHDHFVLVDKVFYLKIFPLYYRIIIHVPLPDPCLADYSVIIMFDNGSSISYTVDAATLFVSIDELEGPYSVTVVAINGAGEGQVGTPTFNGRWSWW